MRGGQHSLALSLLAIRSQAAPPSEHTAIHVYTNVFPRARIHKQSHAKSKRSVNVRSMGIFRVLKWWCQLTEWLCRKCKRYITKHCKWTSAGASALSPFINEQVFVSRQNTQIDSIRLLDKRLLHLLQRARRKHIRSGKHTLLWVFAALPLLLPSQYTTIAHRRSSSSAAPLQPIHQLETWGGKSETAGVIWLLLSDEVLSWSDSVLLGVLHKAPKHYTDTVTVINKICLMTSNQVKWALVFIWTIISSG